MSTSRLIAIAALLTSSIAAASTNPQEDRWIATPSVRAGTSDGPGALAPVFDVEVTPRGEILAAQPTIGTIAVFDSAGRFLRSVGRRGGGPGEFRQLGGLSWRGDTLVVVDLGRLHLFDAALEYVSTVVFPSLEPPEGVRRIIPGAILGDGSVLGVPMFVEEGRAAPVLRLSRSGGIENRIAKVADENGVVSVPVPGRRPLNLGNPWIADELWVPAADGASILVVHRPIAEDPRAATFDIVRIGIEGDTLLATSIEYIPVELGDALRDRWYTGIGASSSGGVSEIAARIERELRSALPAPRFLPPVTRIVAGRDGTIWLRREELRRDSVVWQVLSPAAQPLARISLPAALDVRRVQADRIWGIERDSLDVPYVRIYDVRSASSDRR